MMKLERACSRHAGILLTYEEKNDGPAALIFGDGNGGARLDRLGLRPARYRNQELSDGHV